MERLPSCTGCAVGVPGRVVGVMRLLPYRARQLPDTERQQAQRPRAVRDGGTGHATLAVRWCLQWCCLRRRSGRGASDAVEQRTQWADEQHHDEPAPAPELCRPNESDDPGKQGRKDAGKVQHQADDHGAARRGQAVQRVRAGSRTLARPELRGKCWAESKKGDDQEDNGGNAQEHDGALRHGDPSFRDRQLLATSARSSEQRAVNAAGVCSCCRMVAVLEGHTEHHYIVWPVCTEVNA